MAIRISGTTGIDMGNTSVSNVDVGALDYNAVNKEYADLKQSKSELAYDVNTSSYIPNTLASGAIIERGSNTNGEYVKYADGTLICRKTGLSSTTSVAQTKSFGASSGAAYIAPDEVTTFPSGFVDSQVNIFVNPTYQGFGVVVSASNISNVAFVRRLVFRHNITITYSYIAIGRWK